jgi:hypothetical protein
MNQGFESAYSEYHEKLLGKSGFYWSKWQYDKATTKPTYIVPQPGDLIFYLWSANSSDKLVSHIGIVKKVENGKVYTIEGNKSDMVDDTRDLRIDSREIKGYYKPF